MDHARNLADGLESMNLNGLNSGILDHTKGLIKSLDGIDPNSPMYNELVQLLKQELIQDYEDFTDETMIDIRDKFIAEVDEEVSILL